MSSKRVFLIVALLLQLPLILNPGYFASDELQWLAFADVDSLGQLGWPDWLDLTVFQYRPLTFDLWLLLAHLAGDRPLLMHAAQAILGLGNALLLRQCLRGFGLDARRAGVAAWCFLLMPAVVFTHGWIGTFADQLWLGFALLALLTLLQPPAPAPARFQSSLRPLLVTACTTLALASKEAAVVLPALLLVAAWRRPWRAVLPGLAASAAIVAAYLCLRLHSILYPAHGDSAYAWALANIPRRYAEYLMFPFVPHLHELVAFPWADGARIGVAAFLTLLLLISVASAGWRWLLALLVIYAIGLGPVLILGSGWSHYAYGASAFAVGLVARAYTGIQRWGRKLLWLPGVCALLHSVDLIGYLRHTGQVQQRLYTGLVPRLIEAGSDAPLRIRAEYPADEPMLRRFVTAIPLYRRMPFSSRIVLLDTQDSTPGSLRMQRDGSIVADPLSPASAPDAAPR